MKQNIKKNDQVKVIAGREKGKTGRVVRVIPESGRVQVEKINMVKRHTKPTQTNKGGGILEKEAPIPISNLMVICPKCSKTTRIKRQRLEDGSHVRVCRKCSEQLDG